MRSTINVHLHGDTRVSAPEQADGFLEVSADSDTLNMFLGYDDETRDREHRQAGRGAAGNPHPLPADGSTARPDPIDQAKAAADAR